MIVKKQILHVNNTDNIILCLFVNRKSCEFVFTENINQFIEGTIDISKCNMYARNHNVFRLGIAEIEYVVDHLFFIRLDYTIFMADIHNGTKFFFCHSFIRRIRIYAKDQHDSAGKQVNDENDRSHDCHKKLDDRNIAKRKLLSVDRCIILRCDLSKYKDCHCQNQCSDADHVSTK